MKSKTGFFLFLFYAALVAFLLSFLFAPPLTPLTPKGADNPDHSPDLFLPSYHILGFVPYWNIKKMTPEAASTLTHGAFFTLRLDATGDLVTHNNPREEEPGYTYYKRLLRSGNLCLLADLDENLICPPLVLTFAQLDQDSLESVLTHSTYRKNAIRTITELVDESASKGVNIDFEPLGSNSSSLSDNFTQFIQELHQELAPMDIEISISLYPSAASRPRIWDLEDLSEFTDYFVVMAYDYTLPGDLKTGPNSPLRGAGTLFQHDILTNLAEIVRLVPANQILLGIPFYGYEWEVSDSAKYTPTEGRGATASLERIQELIDENTLELLWDRNSLTPYAVRREDGEVISQIYFEDISSIRLKLDLVKSAGLAGIAIWAVGYEGQNPALWTAISESLTSR